MLRFNTRKKKPKLYVELLLLLVTLAIILPLLLTDAEGNILLCVIVLAAFFIATVLIFLDAFRRQVQYNPYSYNTILYFGLALFFLSIAIQFLALIVQGLKAPTGLKLFDVLNMLMHSAVNYMLLSAPFVLIFSVALFISNIALIRHESKRPQNFLGMLLAVLLVAGDVFLFLYDFYVSGSQQAIMVHQIVVNTFAALYLYFECMIIGSLVAGFMTAGYLPDRDQDYILILGCKIKEDGTPYPLLKGRIDKALAFYNRQLSETGKAAIFIPSGGKGNDEGISESLCMKRYLLKQGVPDEHILMEDQSKNTYENMLFSKQKIDEKDPDAKVIFSTTNYHVFRSGLMARRVKLKAIGIGAATKWYFWPNASVREFIGLLKGHKIKQLIVFLCLLISYIVLTFAVYG